MTSLEQHRLEELNKQNQMSMKMFQKFNFRNKDQKMGTILERKCLALLHTGTNKFMAGLNFLFLTKN